MHRVYFCEVNPCLSNFYIDLSITEQQISWVGVRFHMPGPKPFTGCHCMMWQTTQHSFRYFNTSTIWTVWSHHLYNFYSITQVITDQSINLFKKIKNHVIPFITWFIQNSSLQHPMGPRRESLSQIQVNMPWHPSQKIYYHKVMIWNYVQNLETLSWKLEVGKYKFLKCCLNFGPYFHVQWGNMSILNLTEISSKGMTAWPVSQKLYYLLCMSSYFMWWWQRLWQW